MSRRHRKQWQLNAPVPLATGRVSYPVGDSRRKSEVSEDSCASEWTMRPDGTNFVIDRSKSSIPQKMNKSSRGQHLSSDDEVHVESDSGVVSSCWVQSASRANLNDSILSKPKHNTYDVDAGKRKEHTLQEMRSMLPVNGIRILRANELSEEDVLALGHHVWVPCKVDLTTKSILWHKKVKTNGYTADGYLNVTNWCILLNHTIAELNLTEKSARCHGRVKYWKMYFTKRSDRGHVCWSADEILDEDDVIPFFAAENNGQAEEVVWQVPVKNSSIFIQDINGGYISCGFTYTGNSENFFKPNVLQSTKNEVYGVKSGGSNVDCPADRFAERSRTLPLPCASSTSSYSQLISKDEDNFGNIFDCFLDLTHLHSSDEIESLDVAIAANMKSLLSELMKCTTFEDTIGVQKQHRDEWAEIITRDNYKLLRELCHLTVCNKLESVIEISEVGLLATRCLLTISQLCPVQFKMYLMNILAPFTSKSCVCCGRVNKIIESETNDQNLNNFLGQSYIFEYFVFSFSRLLEQTLKEVSCLINDYVQLHFSPSTTNGLIDEENEISERQMNVEVYFEALSNKAALLQTVLISALPLLLNQTVPKVDSSTIKRMSCVQCVQSCFRGLTRKNDHCEATCVEEVKNLLSVLRWALELSMKTSELPSPGVGNTSNCELSRTVHTTLTSQCRDLVSSCCPLYAFFIGWVNVLEEESYGSSLQLQNCSDGLEMFLWKSRVSKCTGGPRLHCVDSTILSSVVQSIGFVNFDLLLEDSDEYECPLGGPCIKIQLLSINFLLSYVDRDKSMEGCYISAESRWVIVKECLRLLRFLHSENCFKSFAFGSYYVIRLTLNLALELLDRALYNNITNASQGENTKNTLIYLLDAEQKEVVLQTLEDCLEVCDNVHSKLDMLVKIENEEADDNVSIVSTINKNEISMGDSHSQHPQGMCHSSFRAKLVQLLSKCYDV